MYKSTNRFMNKRVSQGRKPDSPTSSKRPARMEGAKRKKSIAKLDGVHRQSVDEQWRVYAEECERLGIEPLPRRR